MTTDTTISNRAVIHRRTEPTRRGVTNIASGYRGNVRSMLTRGNNAIVTGFASTVDLGMIHHRHRRPGCAVMAGLANITRVDVCGRLTRGNHAFVTG